MNRSTRRAIFSFAIFIFAAAGYVVVLYAQGYRYSFSESRFSRTGAVSVRVNTQAQILVNGVFKDNTSFITNTASVGGLLPGTYTVSVQRDNYSKWQKKVTIQEGFVQDFPHVLLLPKSGEDHNNVVVEITALLHPPTPSPTPTPSTSAKPTKTPKPTPTPTSSPTPTPDTSAPYYLDQGTLYVQAIDGQGPVSIATGVTTVYQSPDDQKLIWAVGSQIWVYWLSDQSEQPFHKAGDIAVLGRMSATVHALAWFRDSAHVVVDIGSMATPIYKILELDTRGGQNTISL